MTVPRGANFLYELMPIVDRRRDVERGGRALEALLAAAQRAFDLLEADIGGLYDNWFVETCEDWVLPYLADLLAVPRTLSARRPAGDLRRLVANVVDYRRRKGTPAALALLVSDAGGWPVRAAEARRTLARYPHVVAPPSDPPRTLDVRDLRALADLGGPFDAAARTVDVRGLRARRPSRAGNTGEVALYAWRDVPLTLERVDASALGDGRYMFDPLGAERRLLNTPVDPSPAPERAVPAPLRNTALRDETVPGARAVYLGGPTPAFAIEVTRDGRRTVLGTRELEFRNLARWAPAGDGRALVDVERGRFVLPAGWTQPRVDATWGASGDIGGGTYQRELPPFPADPDDDGNALFVAREPVARANWYTSPSAALDSIVDRTGHVRITVLDSGTYVAPGGALTVVAGVNVPHVELTAAPGARPVLRGALTVRAETPGARVLIAGVVVDGPVSIVPDPNASDFGLIVQDATIVPGDGAALAANEPVLDARVTLRRAICGRIRLPELGARVDASESVVDGTGDVAIGGTGAGDAGPVTTLDRCTVFGDVIALAAAVNGSIVAGAVRVRAGDASSASHSAIASTGGIAALDAVDDAIPRFASRRYGDAAYARLPLDAGAFALGGARNGEELGAYHAAATGRRVANVRGVIDEFVPYGVRAGVIDER